MKHNTGVPCKARRCFQICSDHLAPSRRRNDLGLIQVSEANTAEGVYGNKQPPVTTEDFLTKAHIRADEPCESKLSLEHPRLLEESLAITSLRYVLYFVGSLGPRVLEALACLWPEIGIWEPSEHPAAPTEAADLAERRWGAAGLGRPCPL